MKCPECGNELRLEVVYMDRWDGKHPENIALFHCDNYKCLSDWECIITNHGFDELSLKRKYWG